jgi:thioester reductase-like protein
MKSFLVTGASGVVGGSVLKELLKINECEIVLLLRAAGEKDLAEKKTRILKFYGASCDDPRVTAVSGDITLEQLGLEESIYQTLALKLTHIIHCAASVQLDISREESFKHSVESVKHVLKLLSLAPQCKLDYVSTVGVKGRRPEPLREERVYSHAGFFNTYEEGKYLAELEIYKAMDQGFSITIHRPGMIVGDSQTGKIVHFQVFYHLLKLICGRYSAGFVPAVTEVKIDTVPCDFVGRVIVESVLRPETSGKIIHTCAGFEDSITIGDLQRGAFAAFSKYHVVFKPLKIIPLALFQTAASVMTRFLRGRERAKFELLPQFLDYAKVKQLFLNQESRKLVEGWGISWPAPQDYLAVCLDYYAREYSLRDRESSTGNS